MLEVLVHATTDRLSYYRRWDDTLRICVSSHLDMAWTVSICQPVRRIWHVDTWVPVTNVDIFVYDISFIWYRCLEITAVVTRSGSDEFKILFRIVFYAQISAAK
jgi:hypothetical protein